MRTMLRYLADAASVLRLALLAVFHGVLLYGLFDGIPWALSVASYLEEWLIAEIIALIVTPYFMLLTVRNHEKALWERALILPAFLLVMGGIGGAVRLLRATWFYVLTCIPVVLVEHTREQAERGCALSLMKFVVVIALALVFGNRPLQWPIGTIAGQWMTTELRLVANSMAFATIYFAVTAILEFLILRARLKTVAAAT